MTKPDPGRPWKAVAALVVAALGMIWANLLGADTWETLNFQEWLTIIVPPILTALGVYFVPNPQVPAAPERVVASGPGTI
jgi:hypothetical protein